MNKRKFAAAVMAAVLMLSLGACSKNEHAGTSLPDEHVVEINPGCQSCEIENEHESSGNSEQNQSENSSSESLSTPEENEHGGYDELILVNPTHYIPDDYEVNLVTVQGKYKLDEKAAEHAIELLAAAKKAGYDMQLCSAYRTVKKSEELYQRQIKKFLSAGYSQADAEKEAAKWVAPPGTSEHHTGLAMDLVSSDYWGQYSDLEHDYDKFDSFKWMYANCAEYGFVLRYPEDKQDITGITYEPWHYRYVGVDAAKYIMENGLCLEEYLEEIER